MAENSRLVHRAGGVVYAGGVPRCVFMRFSFQSRRLYTSQLRSLNVARFYGRRRRAAIGTTTRTRLVVPKKPGSPGGLQPAEGLDPETESQFVVDCSITDWAVT